MSGTSGLAASGFMAVTAAVEGAVDDVHLLLAGQAHEVHRVTGNADGELRVFLRVIHRVEQHRAVEDIHVHVISAGAEERVQHAHQVRPPDRPACGPGPPAPSWS